MKFYWIENPVKYESLEDLNEFAKDNRHEALDVPQPLAVWRAQWGAYACYPDGKAVAFWIDQDGEAPNLAGCPKQ